MDQFSIRKRAHFSISIYTQSTTQICVVHQIRNSCRYVVWKDLKEFTSDMKEIYTSVNRDQAAIALERF